MSAADHAVIDDEMFTLCLTGDPELDLDLVLLAMTQSEEALAGLKHAWRTGSDADWCTIAHRARGFSGTMGFSRAAFLWNAAEFEASTPEARAASMSVLQEAVEDVRRELRARGYEIPDTCIPTA